MANDADSEHRAQAWASLGATLAGIGGVGAGTLATVGAGSHLWGDDSFLAGFAFACLLVALGVYALVGEFIGGLPLPATRHEREERRRRAQRRPARVIVPKGRIPLHTPPPIEVSEGEIQRIAASRSSQLGFMPSPGAVRMELYPRKRAEGQLAAAIRSGNVLRVRGQTESQLGYQWRDEVEALVKASAGELDASRFAHSGNIAHLLQCLDDLAQQVGTGTKTLAPSEPWDAYVETMTAFRQALDAHLTEGESLRNKLFPPTLDVTEGEAKVTAWLKDVDDSLAPVPRYRDVLRGAISPAHMFATYEGISEEEGKVVWRLDERLQHLQPLLTLVAPYVEALRGE
jgi:hypothetical protein